MSKQKKYMFIPALVLLFTLAAALPVLAGDDGGTVINENSGAAYSTITEAVANAADGDVLTVGAGTYSESVVLDKALTLNGEPGAVVEGADDYVFLIQASGVVLNGLTMQHAGEAKYAVKVDYDGFDPEDSACWSITNCRMFGTGVDKSAAIHVCGEAVPPSNILIENNVIEHYFFGIDFIMPPIVKTIF